MLNIVCGKRREPRNGWVSAAIVAQGKNKGGGDSINVGVVWWMRRRPPRSRPGETAAERDGERRRERQRGRERERGSERERERARERERERERE